MACDFCGSDDLTEAYAVPTSRIGAHVYSCDDCGLLQSSYTDRANKHTHKSISSGADWGNIRHGKKIRLGKSIETLESIVDLAGISSVLDVGSNRGHFIKYMTENSRCVIKAVEPDVRVIGDYPTSDRLEVITKRYEDWDFSGEFDLIYCCHTLEHASSAADMLRRMRSMLADGGYLYVDVPSAAILSDKDNVEEFFIDKHTYHFGFEVLTNYLRMLGFDLAHAEDDGYNIVIVATKRNRSTENRKTVDAYVKTLQVNLDTLRRASAQIHDMCENQRVVLYGASKIYDALAVHGDLDTSKPAHVVDDYLFGYIDQVHGRSLTPSDQITPDSVDVVVLLTRSGTPVLTEILRKKGITNIVEFAQLLKN